jgi:hypothetical protein
VGNGLLPALAAGWREEAVSQENVGRIDPLGGGG